MSETENFETTKMQAEILLAFQQELGHEQHILKTQPDILWQQMFNRLQWKDEAVKSLVEKESSLRITRKASPWLWLKSAHHESRNLHRTIKCSDMVRKCFFSPEGDKIVAQIGFDTTLWDMANFTLIRKIQGFSPIISPDGSWLATIIGEPKNAICFWEVNTGRKINEITKIKDEVKSLSISSDGEWIAVNCKSSVRVLEVKTGEEIMVLNNCVEPSAFSPVGPYLITNGGSSRLKIWQIGKTRPIRDLFHEHTYGVYDCCFSPNGNYMMTSGYDEVVRVWDANTGEKLHELDDQRGPVQSCAFSPDGNAIITACDDKILRLFYFNNSKWPHHLIGHTHYVVSCAFSPDGHWIVSGDWGNSMRIWDATKGFSSNHLESHRPRARSCRFSPDGTIIASTGDDYFARLWHAETGKAIETESVLTHAEIEVEDCAFSPDGQKMISAGWDGMARVWKIPSGKESLTLHGTLIGGFVGYSFDGRSINNTIHSCKYSPRGDLIMTAGHKGTLDIWHADTGKLLKTLKNHNATAWDFSPDGLQFVSEFQEKMSIWDTKSGKILRDLEPPSNQGGCHRCVYSADGSMVLFAKGNNLGIWDLATGSVLREWEGHTNKITSCDISPDANWIVSSSADQTIKVFNLNTGEELAKMPLPGHVHCVEFHPFEPKLVCCDAGGAIYRLEVPGLRFGAIIVTATLNKRLFKQVLMLHCPACQAGHTIQEDQLNSELTCPTPGCGLRLKLNPFVIEIK